MSVPETVSAASWWSQRRVAMWCLAIATLVLGGWRGGTAGWRWWSLVRDGAWVNPSTHQEFAVVTGWNGVLVLMAVGLFTRLMGRTGPEAAGGALVRAAVVLALGEAVVTVVRGLMF